MAQLCGHGLQNRAIVVLTYPSHRGSDDTIGNSIKRLKKAGYIIQTQVDKRFNVWTYKISEYGNLNNESKETPELKAPAVENTCDLSEQIASTEHISDPIHDSTLTVESDVKPIVLKDYANLIFDEIDKSIMKDKHVDITNCIANLPIVVEAYPSHLGYTG